MKKVEAAFHLSTLNAAIGEPVNVYNKSKGAVNFQWTFSNASPSASNAASPGSIIFQQAGTTQVQLEASSASGCSNVKTGDLHVYDDSFLNLSCWATGVGFSLDGDFSSQQMTNLAVAPNGDILITGYYLGEAEFDSKAGPDFTTDNEVLITNYLARYSQKGVLKWVLNTSRYMVENSINPMAGSKTVIGSDGSTYLLTSYGSFEPVFYSMDGDSIQPYKDVYIYPSSQQYLIKYSEDGILQWATSKAEITGDMLSTHFIDLEMDASGNLYLVNENIYSISPLTGDVLNSVTVFDYPPHLQNIDFIMAGDGSWYVIKRFPETIIRKYSSTGVLEWENSIDGTYESYGGSAATPQNGLALFGHSISLTEFEAQGGTSQSFNPQSIYIVKYDASGRIEWINTAIDGDLHASSIAVNEQGEISLPVQAYAGIAGTLQSQTGGDFVFAPLSSPYIVKYDQNGNIISTNKVFKEDHPMVSTIELVSRDDQTYAFGWESNNILDGVNISPPSTINGDIVHSDHGHDLFVAKFQSDCNPLPASNLSGSVVDIPPGSIVCPGMTFNVTYEVTPGVQLEADNVFSVFLVSENGSGVVEAGSVATTDASGTITAMVPENIPQGNTYKIRLWASNPKLYSDAVGSQIIIKAVAPPDFTYSSTQDLVFRLRPSVALDVDCKWTVEGQTILEHSPLYKFSTTGLIEVCLTTSDECNVERTVCKNVYVECAPVPTNYTYTVSDKTITFTGVTNPSNILNWDFGDGTTANTINTVHTFATYGSKWVCFRSSTECNQGIACKLIELACTQGDLGFGFTSAEKTVQFSNNSSADYNQFNWNFGDGTTSTDTNPSHAYTEPGTYLVTLTSTGKCSIVNTIWQQVTVQCVRPTADFQSEVNNLDVKFFDNSTNAQERLWEFGDGTTSDAISPEHHYQTAGSYQVCLISKNSCTQKKICKTINVTYPNPGIPTNLVATGIDPSTIELTWNDNSTTEQSFKILYRYSAGPFLTLTTLAANVTQFTATNLQCDETYFFKVIVIGQGMGNEVASDEVSGRTLGLNKPVVTSSATKACGGQVIELSAPDGFSNYLWTTGQNTQKISVFVTGEYAVRVGQDNCHSVFSDNVSITFEPLPDPSLFVTNNEIRVISTAEHYQWYKDNVPLPDVNTYYIIPETSGNYKVELTNNGCSAMSETVMFVITGVEEFLEDRLTIYPLPANDILFIDFDDASFKNSSGDISLISATGGTSIHVKKSHHQKTVEIDVSRLPAGLYLCVINVGEKIVHKKVIVH